jgi:membrane protein
MKILTSIFKSFFKDDCLTMAENIAFCGLLAIIPVAMITVSIAGYFLGGSETALAGIIEIATDVLPVGRQQFVANLQSVLDQRSSLSIFGVLFLIFIATLLVASIEKSLDVIFKTQKSRNFFHSRFIGIGVIIWITLLFTLPTVSQVLEGLLHKVGFYFPLAWLMTGKTYFMLVSFLAYMMLIVVIPNQKVYVRYAVVGGVIFSIGIGFARFAFKWYMVFAIQRYNVIYGSLTAVVLLIVWIYYLSLVLLISAEIVAAIQSSNLFGVKKLKA